MRISKELSQSIAKKLTEKSRLAADGLRKEYQQLVSDLYEAQIPKEIKDAFSMHPEWFYTIRSITFDGHGFRWETVTPPSALIANKGTYCHLELNAKMADRIMKSKRKVDKTNEAYKELLRETENALMALRTFKQIEENIPAAKPFLPPPMSNALVCNFDSLNKKINNQPEVKTETVNA